jgi:anaerobic magnesium-protoporphyrin IX monomethyl ester cyclase
MLSILVCHSYFLRFDHKQLERAKPYPPLATLQVAAMLRNAGHEVHLFDAMLAEGVDEFAACLAHAKPQVVLLYEDNYNFLSKMCLARMRSAAIEMIGAARERHARVIAAGSDATDAPEPYLTAGADAVLIGEGFAALRLLAERLDDDLRIDRDRLTQDLSGVATLAQGRVVTRRGPAHSETPPPELPAWDLVDLDRYRAVWSAAHGHFSLNMASSRGCSFRCAWCAKPIWGNQYLQRTPAAVAAEMAHLKRNFAPDHIWFADDIFGFRVDWVRDFASAMHALGGPVPFTIQTRADLVSAKMAAALREAGCQEAWLGAESGSQRILDAMNKGTRVEEVLAARTRLRTAGIRVGFFIQLGYLGEELEDILATRDLVERARPDDIGVSVAYPLPGTKFYEVVKEQLGTKTHWQESDDLAMMFRGTYTSDFYRAVRNLLHDEVSARAPRGVFDVAAHVRTRVALRKRWSALVSNERQFRTRPQEAGDLEPARDANVKPFGPRSAAPGS